MSEEIEFGGESENGTEVTNPVEETEVVAPEPVEEKVEEVKTEEAPEEEKKEEEAPVEEKPATVKLSDGVEVPVSELVAGYMKGADYTRKTMELADLRRQLAVQPKEVKPEPVVEDDVLKDVPPEETARLTKVLKAMGYVKKDELIAERQQETVASVDKSFFDAHPEYKPVNDSNDVKYKALLAELGDYNLTDVSKRAAILEKAHKQVAAKFHGEGKPMTAPKVVTSAATGSKASVSVPAKTDTEGYSDEAIANAKRFGLLD